VCLASVKDAASKRETGGGTHGGATHVRVSVCLCARGSRCAPQQFRDSDTGPLVACAFCGLGGRPFCTPVPFPLPSSDSQLPLRLKIPTPPSDDSEMAIGTGYPKYWIKFFNHGFLNGFK
jgi:hypothetical protein